MIRQVCVTGPLLKAGVKLFPQRHGMGKCRSTRQVKTPVIASSVCACIGICADICAHIPLLWGIPRVFQLEWSHLVLFVHRTLLFCYGIDHVLSIFPCLCVCCLGCACVHAHTHTYCFGWLTSLGSGHASLPRHLLWPPSIRRSHKPLSTTPLWIWFLFDNCLFSGQFSARLRAPWRQRLCALYFLLS